MSRLHQRAARLGRSSRSCMPPVAMRMKPDAAPANQVKVVAALLSPSVAIESKGSKSANTPRDVCTGHKSTKGTTALTSSNNQFSLAIAAPKIAAAPISNMMKLNFASQCQYCKFFIFVSIGIDLRPPWRLLKSANQYIDWKAIDTFIQLMLRRAAPVSEHGLLITI